MVVLVEKGDVKYPCKTEEQLNLFLEAGYTPVTAEEEKKEEKQEEEAKPKKTRKK